MKEKAEKCKNCGDEILLFRGKWIHSWSGSMRCKPNRKVHAEPQEKKSSPILARIGQKKGGLKK